MREHQVLPQTKDETPLVSLYAYRRHFSSGEGRLTGNQTTDEAPLRPTAGRQSSQYTNLEPNSVAHPRKVGKTMLVLTRYMYTPEVVPLLYRVPAARC